ncbi:MAG: alpha/beta fold hydrolase [Chloroflexota bacterium]|nr:alpha/beta fold hydrolase [Chloroflexota bacterium]
MPENRPIDLTYVEHGPRDAPAVVLLHGFPLHGSMWDDQVDALAARFRTIVPDLRGHGRTEAPPGPYTMTDHVADLSRLLDRLETDRAALVGLSMGGYVTMNFLAAHPERAWAAALVDTRAEGDTEQTKAAREAQAREVAAAGMAPFVEAAIPRMFAPKTIAERPELVERYRGIVDPARPPAVVAALQGLALRPDVTPPLRSVRCPTLVVVGSEDVVTPPSDARHIAEAIPDAQLEIIEGAGHLSNMEAPDQFNRVLLNFLVRASERA